MNFQIFLSTFAAVFIAELGDKTQFAAVAAAAQAKSLVPVWLGVVCALALAGTIGVLAGRLLSEWLNPTLMRYAAAGAFFFMGAFTLWQGRH